MKIEIELDEATLDEVVLNHLKVDYGLYDNPEKFFEPDQELLDAFKLVIKYYSSHKQYKEWLTEVKEKKVRNTLDDIDYVDTFYEYMDNNILEVEVPCKTHPDAPHGFNRNASHAEGRYVCDCEHWEPDSA